MKVTRGKFDSGEPQALPTNETVKQGLSSRTRPTPQLKAEHMNKIKTDTTRQNITNKKQFLSLKQHKTTPACARVRTCSTIFKKILEVNNRHLRQRNLGLIYN